MAYSKALVPWLKHCFALSVWHCQGEVHRHAGRRLHEEQRDQLRGESPSQRSGSGKSGEERKETKQR